MSTWQTTHTTADELIFLRHIFLKGNLPGLRNYLHQARHRIWHGTGMNVDPGMVIAEAEDLLDKLERATKPNPNVAVSNVD